MKLRNATVEKDIGSEYLYGITWYDGTESLSLLWHGDSNIHGLVTATYHNIDTADFTYMDNVSSSHVSCVATFIPTYDGAKYAGRWFLDLLSRVQEQEAKVREERLRKAIYEAELHLIEREKDKAAHRAKLKGGKGTEFGEPSPLFQLSSAK